MQYLDGVVKLKLQKLGCFLTWYDNAISKLHRALTKPKSAL